MTATEAITAIATVATAAVNMGVFIRLGAFGQAIRDLHDRVGRLEGYWDARR